MCDEPPQPGAAQGCSHPAVSLTQRRELLLHSREQRQRQTIPGVLCNSVLYSLREVRGYPSAAKAISLPVLSNKGSDCSSLPGADVPAHTYSYTALPQTGKSGDRRLLVQAFGRLVQAHGDGQQDMEAHHHQRLKHSVYLSSSAVLQHLEMPVTGTCHTGTHVLTAGTSST